MRLHQATIFVKQLNFRCFHWRCVNCTSRRQLFSVMIICFAKIHLRNHEQRRLAKFAISISVWLFQNPPNLCPNHSLQVFGLYKSTMRRNDLTSCRLSRGSTPRCAYLGVAGILADEVQIAGVSIEHPNGKLSMGNRITDNSPLA